MKIAIARRQTALGHTVAALPLPARADLTEAARKEGELTWYVAQVDTETAEKLGRACSAAYPGLRVDVTRVTGQAALQRLMLDIENRTPHCDIFSATDISHMPMLKARGELTQYVPENHATMRPQFQALSDLGWYRATHSGRWILIHDRDKIRPEAAPKNWTDLLDRRWRGQLLLAHPAFSGGAGVWALAIKHRYGWQFFEDLAKNNPRAGRSTNDTVMPIGGGECQAGPAFAPAAYRAIDKGNLIVISQPLDGVVVMVFPSAIPARAPHPNAARLFMEWTLSETFSKMMAADGSAHMVARRSTRIEVPESTCPHGG